MTVKPRLAPTKDPHVNDIYLKSEKLGKLDDRDGGTLFSTKLDHMYYKNNRIGICEKVLKWNEFKFQRIVIKIGNLSYSTTREILIEKGKPYQDRIYEYYNIMIPVSEYESEEIEPTLFGIKKREVENETRIWINLE